MATDFEPAVTLRSGQIVPGFTLMDAEGNLVRLKSFRQRRPVLLAFLHSGTCPDCRQWLATLAEASDDLAYRDALPLVIVPDSLAALRPLWIEWTALNRPGVLLADPDHATLGRYMRIEQPARELPALLVAVGRYNDFLDAWVGDEPSQWPSLAEPIATFAFAEQGDCACGLPIWPDT